MNPRTRRILLALAGLTAIAGVVGGSILSKLAGIGAGYTAKVAASAIFVSGRTREDILAGGDLDHVSFVNWRIDEQDQSVTAWIGPISRNAVVRTGLGTSLVIGAAESQVREITAPPVPGNRKDDPRPWPMGDANAEDNTNPEIDFARLKTVIDAAFTESSNDTKQMRRTRAIVIVHNGRIIGEQYGNGVARHMPLIGWSMTKSLLNSLVAILVADGKLDIHAAPVLPEWSDPDDERRTITVDQLLRMSSGLRFEEEYDNPLSDVCKMLFASHRAAKTAFDKPLEFPPGSYWKYSSGTSNIIAAILRNSMDDDVAYRALPRKRLFDRIGMRHAVIETDPSGTFVGSSFSYATARDWARFGLLYLNDGVWLGERILPEGWVNYSRTPTRKSWNGAYGAHWWCNAGTMKQEYQPRPKLPNNYFAARGFQGQSVNIFPTQQVVVVRLGMSGPEAELNMEAFLADVLGCIGNVRDPEGDEER